MSPRQIAAKNTDTHGSLLNPSLHVGNLLRRDHAGDAEHGGFDRGIRREFVSSPPTTASGINSVRPNISVSFFKME